MFKVGDRVQHRIYRRLDEGFIVWASETGKTVKVAWGIEEYVFGYEGTTYYASSLQHMSK